MSGTTMSGTTMSGTTRFGTVLVANRGEIAVRIMSTLRRLGITSVAVHSDADADAPHVRAADRAIRIGPAPARESYLSIERIIAAAIRTGAAAIHPGYGFLSENAAFARACAAAGVVFIGPSPEAIQVMGDKISAKRAVSAAGVPVLAGRNDPGLSDDDLVAAAADIGYPVLVKPAAGGGGKGMRTVRDAGEVRAALVSARREATSAFGDDTLFVERFLARPRHIEVQVLADALGTVIHLGERECSLQRRHQKVVEEAPSVLLDPATSARIGAAAVETARSVGYLGVGTVEFLVSDQAPDEFFFLEMNTRLQVEHPVTELVTGLDLVAEQVRVAAGEPLGIAQENVRLDGHAIEVRLYAEDPERGFLPSTGTVLGLREPVGHPGVRVDSGIAVGTAIGTWYDPMLSKIIAHGADRNEALARLRQALAGTSVLGVRTNLGFLRRLLADPEVRAGRLDTEFIDRELDRLLGDLVTALPNDALAVYGLLRLLRLQPGRADVDAWDVPSGWRIGAPRPLLSLVARDAWPAAEVRVWGTPDQARVAVDELRAVPARVALTGVPGEVRVTLDGDTQVWTYAIEGSAIGASAIETGAIETGAIGGGAIGGGAIAHSAIKDAAIEGVAVWLANDRGAWRLTPALPVVRAPADGVHGYDLRSPMPGVVLAVNVKPGDAITAGQPLIVIEAMKMEHTVAATRDGEVRSVLVSVGEQVSLDQILATTT
jgi:acetyl-CoA/propionyl-CoA carboxylase biotin carboxyl carrier protein